MKHIQNICTLNKNDSNSKLMIFAKLLKRPCRPERSADITTHNEREIRVCKTENVPQRTWMKLAVVL